MQDPFHRIYDQEDALPSEEVYDIHFAEDNLMWVTTNRGVCTYNGIAFKVFSTNDGLSYNTNFKIIPDGNGKLWFNGWDGTFTYPELPSINII